MSCGEAANISLSDACSMRTVASLGCVFTAGVGVELTVSSEVEGYSESGFVLESKSETKSGCQKSNLNVARLTRK